MLRNSTRQFRQRYEANSLRPYTTDGILTLRLTRHAALRPALASPSPSPSPSPASRKLEQSTSTAGRTLQVRTKQSVEVGHRRQLTAPVGGEEQATTSISSIKWQHRQCDSTLGRDPVEFLAALPKNSIFFCGVCYQYVFQIEKQRHFPDCKDALDPALRHSACSRSTAWERLGRMVELAQYTKVKAWEVEELYREIRDNDFCKIYSVSYPRQCNFLTLEEIVAAFVYTYEALLKGAVFTPPPFFTCE